MTNPARIQYKSFRMALMSWRVAVGCNMWCPLHSGMKTQWSLTCQRFTLSAPPVLFSRKRNSSDLFSMWHCNDESSSVSQSAHVEMVPVVWWELGIQMCKLHLQEQRSVSSFGSFTYSLLNTDLFYFMLQSKVSYHWYACWVSQASFSHPKPNSKFSRHRIIINLCV